MIESHSMQEKVYIAIDLKSFYASVECMERNLDPLDVNLVVADETRSDKTICLAVSPALKKHGLPGRCRLFEVRQKIMEINRKRRLKVPSRKFVCKAFYSSVLEKHPEYELDVIIAPPQMKKYIEVSSKIYSIYLKYIAPEDIHVYSIDEVFIDATPYLKMYGMNAHQLAINMIRHVLKETGITATAGIGTNLYLAKVAMDIVAKHIPADKDGVRIAELTEMEYRRLLWEHQPLTDFWRIGNGIASRLHRMGLRTMGDIARVSIASKNYFQNETTLYKEFGINAELLIDHAWGYESCTLKDIKSYKPRNKSMTSGQVLHEPYAYETARIIVREMAESLSLDLVQKGFLSDSVSVYIGYDTTSCTENVPEDRIVYDFYNRKMPKPSHGAINLKKPTASTSVFCDAAEFIFDSIAERSFLVRRINIVASNLVDEKEYSSTERYVEGNLFETDEERKDRQQDIIREKKERNLQEAVIDMKSKFGKNAVLKAMNLQKGAMQIARNSQIGGHKA